MLGGAGKLAGHVNSGGTNPAAVNGAANSRQGASTSEGSIDIAAAFTLNVQKIRAEAIIDGDLTVTAAVPEGEEGGDITVQSLAMNEAIISANGSASNGKIGVGVAVAINVDRTSVV